MKPFDSVQATGGWPDPVGEGFGSRRSGGDGRGPHRSGPGGSRILRRAPRPGLRPDRVPRDVGIRIRPETRAFLDNMRQRYPLTEPQTPDEGTPSPPPVAPVYLDQAELVRVLLVSAFNTHMLIRDRVALALYANATLAASAHSAALVAALRSELARIATSVADAVTAVDSSTKRVERGPRVESLLRVRLGDVLHRRLRDLVAVYRLVRGTGIRFVDGRPTVHDETARRLADDLRARPDAEVERERSAVAEVVRWALDTARVDADDVLKLYVRCRKVMWSRMEQATAVASHAGLEGLRVALDEIQQGDKHMNEHRFEVWGGSTPYVEELVAVHPTREAAEVWVHQTIYCRGGAYHVDEICGCERRIVSSFAPGAELHLAEDDVVCAKDDEDPDEDDDDPDEE